MTSATPLLQAPELAATEMQILRAYAAGRSYAEMAAELHIGIDSVKNRAKTLLAKLGAANAAQAVAAGYDCGLLKPPFRTPPQPPAPPPMLPPLERDLLAVAQAVVWGDPNRTARPMAMRALTQARVEGRVR